MEILDEPVNPSSKSFQGESENWLLPRHQESRNEAIICYFQINLIIRIKLEITFQSYLHANLNRTTYLWHLPNSIAYDCIFYQKCIMVADH